ncbi:MAG: CapA family protein [Oscillospiraceae bacterium]|nr:CapA family protein [Oscillospiraceae bacterium]
MNNPVRISILGDVCPAWGFRSSFDLADHVLVFGDVLSSLKDSDLVIGNLETPISLKGKPIVKCGPCFCSRPNDMRVLKSAGFDVLSLANNHVLDYGAEALLDTIAIAEANEILTVGAGSDRTVAEKPLIQEVKGRSIGVLGFAEHEFNIAGEATAGANLFDPYSSLKDVGDAKARCDYLIVLYHGGIEEYPLPSPLLQKKCRAMADAGADLILCQHSHCIGTRENYHGTEILYGQGNAIFGKHGNPAWDTGLLATVELSDGGSKVYYRAFSAGEKGISFLGDQGNREVLEHMEQLSAKLDEPAYLKQRWDAYCDKLAPMDIPLLLGWNRALNKLNRIMKNRPINWFMNRRKAMIVMNLVRCDAHHEVIQTILENMQK